MLASIKRHFVKAPSVRAGGSFFILPHARLSIREARRIKRQDQSPAARARGAIRAIAPEVRNKNDRQIYQRAEVTAEAVEWAFETRPGSTVKKLILLLMADLATPGNFIPESALDTIAIRSSVSRRNILKHSRDMEKNGFIRISNEPPGFFLMFRQIEPRTYNPPQPG